MPRRPPHRCGDAWEVAQRVCLDPLIKALGDPGDDVRPAAAEAIGQLGDRRGVDPLIKALSHGDSCVRPAAAAALAQLGDPRAVEPLITELLGTDYGGDVAARRAAAACALGQLGDRRAVEPLLKALGDREGDVRKTAAMSLAHFEEAKWESLVHGDPGDLARLGNSGDLRAVEPLIKALGEWDSDSRQVAAEVLGKLRDARAIEPLIKALGDADSDLRKAASEALNNLGQPKWKNVIRGDNDDWTRLGATANPVAVEALIKCLSYGCGNHTADSSKTYGCQPPVDWCRSPPRPQGC